MGKAQGMPEQERAMGGALEHKVDVLVIVRAQHVPQFDDIFVVVQLLQKHAQCCQGAELVFCKRAAHMISRNVLCASVAF